MSSPGNIENIQAVGGDIGGAVSDIFGAIGDEQAASAYEKEAQIAGQEAQISQTSAAIQGAQMARAVTQAVGTEAAGTEAAGFTMGGNASDLMRQSLQQGALAKSLIAQQGAINTLGFQQQEQAAQGKAAASKTAGAGGFLGGLVKGASAVAGIASLFSDSRLKRDIKFLRVENGYYIYQFRYIGSETLYEGVMAQEILATKPDAVHEDEDGFLSVDYAALGLEMKYG